VDIDTRSLNVGILGGSITGCAMAVELSRLGCQVAVLERRGEETKDRGAGIGLPPALLDAMVERDLIDANVPTCDVFHVPHLLRDDDEKRLGHVLWDQPALLGVLHWGTLYANLRRRVPAGAYVAGCDVVAIRPRSGGKVEVETRDGRTLPYDLLVCADGYRSVGRRTLFPDAGAHYVGYVLWRGAVAESELDDVGPLEGALCWPSYNGGHGPFQLVPGADGSVAPGRRMVQWGLYLRVFEVGRAELLTGRDAPAYDGPMAPDREARLKAWVPSVLPAFFADVVTRSRSTSVMKVHESTVPAYRVGRVCLAGDAAALARPHTGTQVLKGVTDATTLADALRSHSSLEDALADWSEERTVYGNELVRLAGQIGRALAAQRPESDRFESLVTVPSEIFG
jgi:2-polyprenyl-6-methoxyphenol hydroxylase-like FAD-dependent oxidoreductase